MAKAQAAKNQVIKERRAHQRVARPFEGSWIGASGSGQCRIADLSVGGCFVQSLAMPAAGETTRVTITVGAHTFSLSGRVVEVEKALGFSVQFTPVADDDLANFKRLLGALLDEPPATPH